MNLCQIVKHKFRDQLSLVRERTNGNGNESGFTVCLQGHREAISEVREGTARSLELPSCEGNAVVDVHSHQHSAAMENRLGSKLVRRYTGHPSALDLSPNHPAGAGCVLADDMLTCFRRTSKALPAIQALREQEPKANLAFEAWMRGDIDDHNFSQVIKRTIRSQRAAMKQGGYCYTKI